MNKSKLKEIADSVFERHPKVDKVFITSDGQAFFEEQHAKNHSVNNRTGKELEINAFLRKESVDNDLDLNNMDRVQLEAFIKDNGLEVIFYAETADDDLRTMIENAIEKASETEKAKKTTSKKPKK